MPRRVRRTKTAGPQGPAGELAVTDRARSPSVQATYQRLQQELARGRLSATDRCLVGLMVAQRSGSAAWLAAEAERARKSGLSEEQIEAAREGCAGSSRQTALLFLAGRMVVNRGHLAQADLSAIRQAGLSDDELLEAILLVALKLAAISASHAARIHPPLPTSHEFGASRD